MLRHSLLLRKFTATLAAVILAFSMLAEGTGVCPCEGHDGIQQHGQMAHGSHDSHGHHGGEPDDGPTGFEDCRLLCPLVGASDPPQIAEAAPLPLPTASVESAPRPAGSVEVVRLTLRHHFLPPPLAPPGHQTFQA
ncbi:MAG: hypothetical protein EA422_04630 [Gemmatimonadales bacterium]|nr:MAG: hypothetical protein EA422_04630 [Gemmatimonadales bacterium]